MALQYKERKSEMGKILLVVSDKGGVGKSTYVANTGAMLVNKGKSVIILKTDKNPDLLSWNEKRVDNGLLTIPMATSATKLSALASFVRFSLSIVQAMTAKSFVAL